MNFKYKELNTFTSNRPNNREFIKISTFSEAGPFKKAKSWCDKQEPRQREKNPHFGPINHPFTASSLRLGST